MGNNRFSLPLWMVAALLATPTQAWTSCLRLGGMTTTTTTTTRRTSGITTTTKTYSRRSLSTTSLEARRTKPGSLGTLAKEGLIEETPSFKTTSKRNPSKSIKTSSGKAGGKSSIREKTKNDGAEKGNISPGLAAWIANQEGDGKGTKEEITMSTTDDSSTTIAPATFQSFDHEDDDGGNDETRKSDSNKRGNTSVRRVKQSQRNQVEEERQVQIESAVQSLERALEGKNNLEEILAAVNRLLSLPPSPASSKENPRLLFGGKQRYDYRLAWVGSDDAICHVGTGLHKVPLARLQELFWTCLGKNRVELLEVIRILGPFPNVRNTLQGTAKLIGSSKSTASSLALQKDADNQVPTLNIVMDSMIDGTGKEILAGTDDNIRRVNLQLFFADARAMVAVVPPEDGTLRTNPLEKNGANVLVFLREEELNDKLDALRVS